MWLDQIASRWVSLLQGVQVAASLDLWVEYLLRFSHLVSGIAWIGSSFYFIWLDSSFEAPEVPRHNVDGELFMVHGGFYYQVEKKKIYPGELPKTLHWFKWEATLTWITGFFLFGYLYYMKKASYLIDPTVMNLTQGQAIGFSLALIAGAWFVYDFIWAGPIAKIKSASAILSLALFVGLIYLVTHIFSGRGAFIQMGALLGSLMLFNVWVRILPGQSKMLKEAQAGRVPDYSVSIKSKTRSVHNTYFIFPVLFIMLSNHYPSIYNHQMNWLLLTVLSVSGAMFRHAMVTKKPIERWLVLPAAIGLMGLVYLTGASRGGDTTDAEAAFKPQIEFAQVKQIMTTRCLSCHSSHPTDDVFKETPKGVVLETEEQIRSVAEKIQLQVVVGKTMPFGNKTLMTDDERSTVATWLKQTGLVP